MSTSKNKSGLSASSDWPRVPESNLEAWTKSAQKSAPNGDVDQLGWKTPDGIHLKALYTTDDIEIAIANYKKEIKSRKDKD